MKVRPIILKAGNSVALLVSRMAARRRAISAAGWTGGRAAGVSLILTLAVWTAFSWPLPRSVFSGIPAAWQRAEAAAPRAMIPGDHLQLLYHFWLFNDTVTGGTRPYRNVYEFNTGNDTATPPVEHYLPYSAVYGFGAWLGGRAFGWNFAGLVSLWITFLATWRLARRYTPHESAAIAAAAFAIAFPYRWVTLMGGSPTGFGMSWVPVLLLGLDMAVRDGRGSGGLLAGAAILLSAWSDTHVFFFGVLLAPAWFLVALAARGMGGRPPPAGARRVLLALLPMLAVAVLAFGESYLLRRRLAATLMSQGRSLADVKLFSPHASALFGWGSGGHDGQAYLGFAAASAAAAALGFAVWVLVRDRRRGWRPAAVGFAVVLGIALVAALALGMNGPGRGWLLVQVRRLVPPYAMIRQPAKALSVMPTLLAVAAALGMTWLAALVPRRRWAASVVALVFAAIAAAEYGARMGPSICLLDSAQGAYRAVAEDAAGKGRRPHAMAVTLWPGDAHWTSVCLHDASLYRIRLANGYRPAVPREYTETFFPRFESANMGLLDAAQLDELVSRGIRYIVFHEDSLPEKASPWPVGYTRANLLGNPRLRLIAQAGAVRAFEILTEPEAGPAAEVPMCPTLFPSRVWEAEGGRLRGGAALAEAAGASGRAVRFGGEGGSVALKATGVGPAPDARVMIRLKGQGRLRFRLETAAGDLASREIDPAAAEWTWMSVPVAAPAGWVKAVPWLVALGGAVEVDALLLTAGSWNPPGPGESVEYPAACFCHAGRTDAEAGAVVLRREHDDIGSLSSAMHGFHLPMPSGRYEAELLFETAAPAGTVLGSLTVSGGGLPATGVQVAAGTAARLRFEPGTDVPMDLVFSYSRMSDLTIRAVRLTGLH